MLNFQSLREANSKIFLIEGDDPYWCDHAVNFFINLVPNENRSFNLNILDEPSDFRDILNAVEFFSFFSGNHVIIVKNISISESKSAKKEETPPKTKSKKKTKVKEKNSDIIEAAIDGAGDKYLVFLNTTGLSANIKKKMTIIDAKKSDPFELRTIISNNFSKIGGIEASAINTLITYTVCNMAKISTEMSKLEAYCEGRQVTLADVELLVSDTEENQMYDFTGAITSGNKSKALKILDKFITAGVSYIYILVSLTNQFRRMYYVKISDKSDDQLVNIFSVKQFAIYKARELAKNYSAQTLSRNLFALTETESNIKSGLMTEKAAFERIISILLSS
ncbi:MAG: DNA polymerase III subunit delta [Christensenellaceae bacterium]|nr:DNA polymerase III subunit delta [Christensenellaceae bacterium]